MMRTITMSCGEPSDEPKKIGILVHIVTADDGNGQTTLFEDLQTVVTKHNPNEVSMTKLQMQGK